MSQGQISYGTIRQYCIRLLVSKGTVDPLTKVKAFHLISFHLAILERLQYSLILLFFQQVGKLLWTKDL
jgi:hypothetical protein